MGRLRGPVGARGALRDRQGEPMSNTQKLYWVARRRGGVPRRARVRLYYASLKTKEELAEECE